MGPDGNEVIPSEVLRAPKLFTPVPPLETLNGEEKETVDEKVCGCVQVFEELFLTYLKFAESMFRAYPPEDILIEVFGTKTPLGDEKVIGKDVESNIELLKSIFNAAPDTSDAFNILFETRDISPLNTPPSNEKVPPESIFHENELYEFVAAAPTILDGAK